MNPKQLHKLQSLAKDLSIIYIEEDKLLHKQMEKVLGKIFSNVIHAYNGLEGFNKYKKFNPDIILTDLVLEKKNSVEMLVDILEYNPNAIIIVLSELNDDVMLLQSIDIDINDFIFKPFDIDKLVTSFLNIIINNRKKDIDPLTMFHLENIRTKKTEVAFINSFKGIAIQNSGHIVNIENNEIMITVQASQNISIAYEKQTVIYIKEIDKYIHAELLFFSKMNDFITLINPEFIDFKSRDIKYKRIKVDKSFQVTLHHHTKVIEVSALVTSFMSIELYEKSANEKFNVKDKVDLTLGFENDGASSLVKEKKFVKIFSQGEVLSIEPYKNGNKIVVKLKVKKSGERTFKNYLQLREIEIINEFKRLLKNKR
jgi:DNA-binding response OmpR family regulator